MEAHLLDYLHLFGRWVHLITAIAWIGASFYFVWLDNHLLAPRSQTDRQRGISGEIWALHGGGFYHSRKYQLAPPALPQPLHWFQWEAYSTWLSGMFLLVLLYWYGARTYLIDPAVADLSPPAAIAISAGSLVVGWVAYDRLCKWPRLVANSWALSVALWSCGGLLAFGLCQVFGGRAAYLHFGAVLGTIMVANVLFVIIPGQRELVAACAQGREPEAGYGSVAKQRSVHNTYLTLPVLLTMISNHYAGAYGHAWNWLILILIATAGVLVRVYFVARHQGTARSWSLWAAGFLLAVAVGVSLPLPPPAVGDDRGARIDPPDLALVTAIVHKHCVSCHAAQPTEAGFTSAPKGMAFETQEQIVRHAAAIVRQSVQTRAMPLGNLSGMSDAERALIGRWFESRIKP